jgi:hypothetical protein
VSGLQLSTVPAETIVGDGKPASGPQQQRAAVELFPSQLDQIVRSLTENAAPTVAALLCDVSATGPAFLRELERRYRSQLESGALSRSLLRGFHVVACFLPEGVEHSISEVSEMLKLNISTTYRYVATLVVMGVLEQNTATKKYRLPQPPGESTPLVISQQGRVVVELLPSQLDQIARSLVENAVPTVAALLSGLMADVPVSRVGLEERYGSQLKDGRLSVSLVRGFLVLACFLPHSVERGISEISDKLELNVSTTHRYVATLVVLRVLEQNAATKKYRLPHHVDDSPPTLTAVLPAAE